MKRLHVHISVSNLADSIRFYSSLFASEPSVEKADYAKWMLDDPRVNFAISQRGAAIGLNHLGVQVESADELQQMHTRLNSLQSDITEESGAACCYAKSDKYWVTDHEGIAWETFHTLDSIPVFGGDAPDTCCVPQKPKFEKSEKAGFNIASPVTTQPAQRSQPQDFKPHVFVKFFLLQRLAVGGMAEIYRAKVSGAGGFEKEMVVKRILLARAQDQGFIKMLVNEAKLTVQLTHNNIAQIYECGAIDHQYFIAMELVNGVTLKDM